MKRNYLQPGQTYRQPASGRPLALLISGGMRTRLVHVVGAHWANGFPRLSRVLLDRTIELIRNEVAQSQPVRKLWNRYKHRSNSQ